MLNLLKMTNMRRIGKEEEDDEETHILKGQCERGRERKNSIKELKKQRKRWD